MSDVARASRSTVGSLFSAGARAHGSRGFSVIARCAGLVGHIHEERAAPAMRALWQAAEQAVPYDGGDGGD